jgi:hypothetical protein
MNERESAALCAARFLEFGQAFDRVAAEVVAGSSTNLGDSRTAEQSTRREYFATQSGYSPQAATRAWSGGVVPTGSRASCPAHPECARASSTASSRSATGMGVASSSNPPPLRRTCRSHAGVPLPYLPLFEPPSPIPPSFQETGSPT